VIYAQILASMHRFDEAIREAQLAYELDRHNQFYASQYAAALESAHRFDEAIALFREIVRTEPNSPIGVMGVWDVAHLLGRDDEARSASVAVFRLTDKSDVADAIAAVKGDYRAAMLAGAEALERHAARAYVAAIDLAQLRIHAGDIQRALDYIERAATGQRDSRVVYVVGDALYEQVWNDPRVRALFTRVDSTIEPAPRR
jgi:tetratricopeptide (TPR) repeat protein